MLKGFQRFRLVAPAVVLAVIIIALVGLASTPRPMSAAAADKGPNPPKFIQSDPPIPAPATPFKDMADADKTLADFKGKVLIVNFWATWCAPCVKEMPMLEALQAKLGGPGFQVLAVSQDREGAQIAKPFIEVQKWKNAAFFTESPGHFARDANLRGLPTSLLIDKQGREVARVEGEANWLAPEVEQRVKALMAAP
jgi:thiol-disulfide isomerase/thioredoxin